MKSEPIIIKVWFSLVSTYTRYNFRCHKMW